MNIPTPVTRREQYLSAIAGEDHGVPESPITREEQYLQAILDNGGGGGGGTTNYNHLSNKPQVEGVTLSGNKTASDLGLASASALDGKVDKVSDKGLSTNDYTNADKAIVDGVATALDGKVDKVSGKGLSTNDYTTEDRTKLTGLVDIQSIGTGLNLNTSTGELTATGAAITIDTKMSDSSVNPVQNKVITAALGGKQDSLTFDNAPTENSNNPVKSGGIYTALAGKVDTNGTDRLMTAAEGTKLAGIDSGAEVNTIETVTLNGTAVTPDANRNIALTVITNAVNDLINYYKKTETYTKTEVDSLISAISTIHFEVVATLPTTDIQTNVIYLVPKSPTQTSNVKDEYINLDGTSAGWEKIGDTDIDLSDYVTTTALNTALADYTTTANLTTLLAGKVDVVSGKGLSTNDYDNTAKGIVDGVTSALADKVDKSNTAGLLKNDGTVDTTAYAKQSEMSVTDGTGGDADKTTIQLKSGTSATVLKSHQSLTDYVQKSQTAGLLKNDGTVDTSKYAPMSFVKAVGAYNLLDNTWSTSVISSVTVTKVADGTITTSGTSSAADDQEIGVATLKAGTYKLVGCPADGGSAAYRLKAVNKTSSNTVIGYDDGEGLSITLAADATVGINLVFASSVPMTGLTFKPMITPDTGAAYADYIPYAMTNKELTETKAGITITTTDPGEGTALADNTLLVVVEGE